jgi:hypothetical protein
MQSKKHRLTQNHRHTDEHRLTLTHTDIHRQNLENIFNWQCLCIVSVGLCRSVFVSVSVILCEPVLLNFLI